MDKTSYVELVILQLLGEGPQHGYALTQAVQRRSNQQLLLPAGSLYPALHRLERRGLVESHWQRVNGRALKQYVISESGQLFLQDEKDNWWRLVNGVNDILGLAA